MSTHFFGEGNIGSPPEFHQFPNNKDDSEPHRLLRLNVYFDNPVPVKEGFEDRGGFWASVGLWHAEAQSWSTLFQKGMRVLVQGRIVCKDWKDGDDNPQVTFQIEARRIGILPYRLERITLALKTPPHSPETSQP